jgi:hypothetical protein
MIQALEFSSSGAVIAGVSSTIVDGRCMSLCIDSPRTSLKFLRTRNPVVLCMPPRSPSPGGKQEINTPSAMKTQDEWLPMLPCKKAEPPRKIIEFAPTISK